jgi:hypothetical protein
MPACLWDGAPKAERRWPRRGRCFLLALLVWSARISPRSTERCLSCAGRGAAHRSGDQTDPVHRKQRCPAGMVVTGVVTRSGDWLDSIQYHRRLVILVIGTAH